MERAKHLCEEGGQPGLDIFDYEWRNFKRVVQCSTLARTAWRPQRMDDKAFYEKLYRLDDSAAEDRPGDMY